MIPYVIVGPLSIGPLDLQPFGILVAIGVLLGIELASRRARHIGLDENDFRSFLGWILIPGFVGAHVFDTLLYHPREVLEAPWSLLMIWAGLSSFGGFVGATLGAWAWKFYVIRDGFSLGALFRRAPLTRRSRPARLLAHADVVMAVFPLSWAFGRAGCAVVHDHPGRRTSPESWLSVAFGPGPSVDLDLFQLRHGVEPRYDLGLLEMGFAAVVAAAFALTWRHRKTEGWYVAAACVAYAPARFALDFLRATDLEGGDVRYAALTPAQWGCMGLAFFGIAFALWLRSGNRRLTPRMQPLPDSHEPHVGAQRH